MSKFKAGDKVVCVNDDATWGIKKGDEYVVAEACGSPHSGKPSLRFVGKDGGDSWWYEYRFELVGPVKTPHKHAAIIKAWADGAVIQVRTHRDSKWHDANATPAWSVDLEYRVKPELKSDVVKYGVAKLLDTGLAAVYYLGERNTTIGQNLCLTFDGETRELKSASVINKD